MSMEATRELDVLRELYTAGLQDNFLDSALRKIIESLIARSEMELQRVRGELERLEQQYGMRPDEFWQQYQAGKMPDTADFMEWNAFYKMRQRITSRLNILRGYGHG